MGKGGAGLLLLPAPRAVGQFFLEGASRSQRRLKENFPWEFPLSKLPLSPPGALLACFFFGKMCPCAILKMLGPSPRGGVSRWGWPQRHQICFFRKSLSPKTTKKNFGVAWGWPDPPPSSGWGVRPKKKIWGGPKIWVGLARPPLEGA